MTTPVPGAPAGTASQRTRLAWSRTTLTLTAGGLTMARLLWPHSSVIGVTVLGATLAIAVTLVGLTGLYERALSRVGARGPDGVLLAVVATGTCVIGAAALALVALG